MESIILSFFIDTKEGQDVAIADVVGAYLLTKMQDYTLVKLVGESAIICKVNSTFMNYVKTENDKPVLYLKLKKGSIWMHYECFNMVPKLLLDL